MRKRISCRQIVSVLLVTLLFAATALATAACTKQEPTPSGKTFTFTFEAVMKDGTKKTETVTTAKDSVGAALLEKGLIAGENGDFGLYVKTVYGETLDYDTDGMYWAFYVDGAMAPAGVDSTKITEGAVYSMKAEK